MRHTWRRLLLALALCLAACGDATFVVRFNSGLIAGSPRCDSTGGEFDLRDQQGLVLVIITNGTDIFIAGSFGTCTDLAAGNRVDVTGRQSGDQIVATSITVR